MYHIYLYSVCITAMSGIFNHCFCSAQLPLRTQSVNLSPAHSGPHGSYSLAAMAQFGQHLFLKSKLDYFLIMCVLISGFNPVLSAYVSNIFPSNSVLITVPNIQCFLSHSSPSQTGWNSNPIQGDLSNSLLGSGHIYFFVPYYLPDILPGYTVLWAFV